MQAERWRQIEDLYHAAILIDEDRRKTFLDEACTCDEHLRREIDSLLAYEGEVSSFMESPALELAAKSLAKEQKLGAGTVVSHYRLVERIGSGGMGIVYKAEDTTLHRLVALKFLSQRHINDPRSLVRLRREARSASALDHPNICTIYEIGDHHGEPFIAMQFLAGQTLKETIGNRALKIEPLLAIGIQIADALNAAHQAGIVHRDIKPANIFVTAGDQVKVLDFGIAKWQTQKSMAVGERRPISIPETSATSEYLTSPGALVGTVAYMSPEQVSGDELDSRTDLFSFGAVLYEMATGAPPFQRERPGLICHSIQYDEPRPLKSINPKLPVALGTIISKALEKDRELRYQNASEISADLRRLQIRRSNRINGDRTTLSVLLVLLTLIIAAATFALLRRNGFETPPKLVERQITDNPPEDFVLSGAISPDSKTLAYRERTGLYLRSIDSGETRPVALPPELKDRIFDLTWFPDGGKLLASIVAKDKKVDGCNWDMWAIPATGNGTASFLWPNVCQGSISPDRRSLAFMRDVQGSSFKLAGVWIAGLNGGPERMLRSRHESEWFFSPVWSPDGRWIAYMHAWQNAQGYANAIEIQPSSGGPAKTLLSSSQLPKGTFVCDMSVSGLCLAWSADWRIDFSAKTDLYDMPSSDAEHSLWEIATHPSTAEEAGKPSELAHWRDYAAGNLTFTRDGKRLFFLKSKTWSDVYLADLAPDKTKLQPPRRFTLDNRGSYLNSWTFDSKTILFSSDRTARRQIFKQGLNQEAATPLFDLTCEDCQDAVITPDQAWILYREFEQARPNEFPAPTRLMRRRTDGGSPEVVLELPRGTWLWSYACGVKPGSACVMSEPEGTNLDLGLYMLDPLHGKGKKLGTIKGPINGEPEPWSISPDGSRIASGTNDGHIRILSLGERNWSEISLDSGCQHLTTTAWAADGNGFFATCGLLDSNDLIYVTPTGTVTHLLHGSNRQWLTNPLPSPNGKYLAFEAETWDSNVWTLESSRPR